MSVFVWKGRSGGMTGFFTYCCDKCGEKWTVSTYLGSADPYAHVCRTQRSSG